MATWKDRLRKGSFRGVPFRMRSADAELGRRLTINEFPDRVDVVPDDEGPAPRRFAMEVYVIGPQYDQARDALEAALLTAGPGTLVHPYRGQLEVIILPGLKVREVPEEGGCARLSFTCVEQAPPQASTAPATGPRVTTLANAVTASSAANFVRTFSTTGMPSNFVASAVSRVRDAAAAMAQVQARMNGALGIVGATSNAISAFGAQAADLVATPAALASAHQGLVASVIGAGLGLVEAGRDSARALRDAAQLYRNRAIVQATGAGGTTMHAVGASDPPSSPTTPLARREASNRDALNVLIRASATAELARAAAGLPFTSYQEASAFGSLVSAQVDDLLGLLDDETFAAMQNLRAATREHVAIVASRLPELRSFVVPVEAPVLLIAHWLYGDARRADEIIVRNAPKHPGLIPAGTALEVAAS